jgi:tRNA (mo5U34)-methyltransferase
MLESLRKVGLVPSKKPEGNPFSDRTREELLHLAKSYQWVHAIDLGGFVTPGLWGTGNPETHKAMHDIDFKGKKVLEIGCWDGLWSFMAEELGATTIWATDLINQRDFTEHRTFEIAAALRQSCARWVPDLSVYDVERLGMRDFDVVIYCGIYYHLKDPVRAFATLRRVIRDGGVLLVEGVIVDEPGCHADFYYKRNFCGDPSNWWVPTPECLRQWVECSFFRIEKEYDRWGHEANQRHCLTARAVRGRNPGYVRPPEDLQEFNT